MLSILFHTVRGQFYELECPLKVGWVHWTICVAACQIQMELKEMGQFSNWPSLPMVNSANMNVITPIKLDLVA